MHEALAQAAFGPQLPHRGQRALERRARELRTHVIRYQTVSLLRAFQNKRDLAARIEADESLSPESRALRLAGARRLGKRSWEKVYEAARVTLLDTDAAGSVAVIKRSYALVARWPGASRHLAHLWPVMLAPISSGPAPPT